MYKEKHYSGKLFHYLRKLGSRSCSHLTHKQGTNRFYICGDRRCRVIYLEAMNRMIVPGKVRKFITRSKWNLRINR